MCPGLSSKAPNPGVDSKTWWNHGPSPQESQYSRSAVGTTTSRQQVLPENAAAPRVYFLNPVVISFCSIWQSSSCSPWLPSWWRVPVCACGFLWGSSLLCRKDVMKRGRVEEGEVYNFPTKSRPTIWKIHLCFRKKVIEELAWRLGNLALGESPSPWCQGYFCLLISSFSGSNGETVLTAGPKTQLLPMHPAKGRAQGQTCAGKAKSLWW